MELEQKFKYVGKCKTCNIRKYDSRLFDDIHSLRFFEHKSLTDISKYIVVIKQKRNLDRVVLPSEQNLSNHFKKHLPIDLIAYYKTQNATSIVRKNSSTTDVDIETTQMVENLSETIYTKLENLYTLINQRFLSFDESQNKAINILNVSGYAILTKELRSCLVEANKIKQNEQLVKLILKTAFEQYTMSSLVGIMKELEALKLSLRSYIKDTETVDRLIDSVQYNIGDHLASGGKTALVAVKETYNLK